VVVNKYESLYESDSKVESDNETDGSYMFDDAEGYEGYEFMIPKDYKGYEQEEGRMNESNFNVECQQKHEDVLNCEVRDKWRKEEWLLLDSGSTVNVTNQNDRLWNQHESCVTVTVGQGSEVEGQKEGWRYHP
jgi:hypothetical protein